MAILKNSILIFLILVLSHCLYSDQFHDLDLIYDKLVTKYLSIHSYSADFIQINIWPDLDISKTSEGKIWYNSNHLLLKYIDPESQFLLINDDLITMYDPISNQLLLSNNFNLELRPDLLIKQYWDISEKVILASDNSTVIVQLYSSEYETIEISLVDFLVTELSFTDPDSNKVRYIFTNPQLNPEISDSVFNFNYPKDCNIIDNRY